MISTSNDFKPVEVVVNMVIGSISFITVIDIKSENMPPKIYRIECTAIHGDIDFSYLFNRVLDLSKVTNDWGGTTLHFTLYEDITLTRLVNLLLNECMRTPLVIVSRRFIESNPDA